MKEALFEYFRIRNKSSIQFKYISDMFLIRLIICTFFLLFPILTFASGLSKQEACAYPEGIHREEVYIYWPWKIVQVDEFLKKDGFLYYFIHTFPDRDSLSYYRDIVSLSSVTMSSVRNTGSYMASYDCARSKVKFYPNIRSLGGTAYGKMNWYNTKYLSYSLVGSDRDPCSVWPDSLLDLSTMTIFRLDRMSSMLRSTRDICIGRSMYKNINDQWIQFDIEEHHWDTEESFYSRYMYQFSNKKLKKIG